VSGTVNISRGIWSDTAFKDQPFTEREAFMWMVMEASWKPREKRVGSVVVNLERGQLASSIRFMADAWNWQKSTVDRFLKRLENRDMIGTASGTGVTVITICKYSEYQNAPSDSGTPKKEKAGQQRDSSGTNENKGLIPEARREEDTDVSLQVSPAGDVSEAVRFYNDAAAKVGWPSVQKITPTRSRSLKARIADAGGMEGWRFAIERATQSDFLSGRTAKPWTGFGFDWLTKAANFTKLMEGNYDNRINHPTGPAGFTQGHPNRPDPAIEQALRLAGIGRA
jgi:hypothetical protein